MCLLALLEHREILSKGVRKIYFPLPENYYKALLRRPLVGASRPYPANVMSFRW